VYFDTEANSSGKPAFQPTAPAKVSTVTEHEGQESYKIETEAGIYYYHKTGAGFASLEDIQGNDWISYHPKAVAPGSDGQYRGIPNLGNVGHPGYPDGGSSMGSTSQLGADGPVKIKIRSISTDNNWEFTWDIYPKYATLTVLRTGGNYWWLYEGTPGGTLDQNSDYSVISSGLRRVVNIDWNAKMPDPEWIYFGDNSMTRVLYIIHHVRDTHDDQFWQMNGDMTVFGFGREYRCCAQYLTETPNYFTIGLAEDSAFAIVSEIINSSYRPLSLTLGSAEKAGTTGVKQGMRNVAAPFSLAASSKPMDDTGQILFILPRGQKNYRVDLDLFTVTGQRIGTLYSGVKTSGKHYVELGNLKNGVYMCRLNVSGLGSRTIKVVIAG
jgi:hypothetical protein